MRFSQIGLYHRLVVGNFLRDAFRNGLAKVDGVDSIRDGHDDLHDMFDNQDADPIFPDFFNQIDGLIKFTRI